LLCEVDVISAVVPGSKRAEGEASEDAVAEERLGDVVLVALADGAGSARRGGYGARLAAQSAVEALQERLADLAEPLEDALRAAIEAARLTLSVVAGTADEDGEKAELGDLSTTLSVAGFGPRQVGVASIGDGVHILRDVRGELSFVAMAADTEIANHTDFVTSTSMREKMQVAVRPSADVESLLLSSDGLDSQLVGRDKEDRWPLATAGSLLNAPVLDDWDGSDFERLLTSKVIRQQSDDDCSLVLVRRLIGPDPDEIEVGGLPLVPWGQRASGRRAWRVRGCADLVAIELSGHAASSGAICRRREQVWDRGRRYPPVCWPIRRLDKAMVLLPRTPPGSQSVAGLFAGASAEERDEMVKKIRECVDAMHAAGVAHGALELNCFTRYPDRSFGLWDPGPGMFEGAGLNACRRGDVEFLGRIEGSEATGAQAQD
jgi:hypothetical protein